MTSDRADPEQDPDAALEAIAEGEVPPDPARRRMARAAGAPVNDQGYAVGVDRIRPSCCAASGCPRACS